MQEAGEAVFVVVDVIIVGWNDGTALASCGVA